MSDPFVGEIRMFGGNFAPAGWAFCDGQLVPISENDILFNLIGTTFGGDGQSTFGLPDLRSRVPLHMGNGFTIGEAAGVEQVTLTIQQIPVHNHAFIGSSAAGTSPSPTNNIFGQAQVDIYTPGGPGPTLAPQLASIVGGNQPHDNRQPYLVISFIISLFGLYPSPN